MSKKSVKVKNAKKGRRLAVIIMASILLPIIIACFVLGFINSKGFYDFADYNIVSIENNAGKTINIFKTEEKTDSNQDQYDLHQLFNPLLKRTRYSVLRGIMEGVANNSYSFETEEVEYYEWNEDDERELKTRDERIMISRNNIASAIQKEDGTYVLTFTFNRAEDNSVNKCIKVEGEEVWFDTAKLLLKVDASNIIENYKLYLYDSQKLFGSENEDYEIPVVLVNAKAFNLHEVVNDKIFG